MPISIIQKSRNHTFYQEVPLTVTLPSPTTAGSKLIVVVFGGKSAYPFNVKDLITETLNPTVSDDKSDSFTQVTQIVGLSQEANDSPPTAPDVSGYYLNAYVFSATATTGAQVVSVAAFYPDIVLSPPMVQGRPVFNGGMSVEVFEIGGLISGVTGNATYVGEENPLGNNILTPGSANSLVLEAGMLIDSSCIDPDSKATLQYTGRFPDGSSYYAVQTTQQTSAAANAGFGNPVSYGGGVIAVSLH